MPIEKSLPTTIAENEEMNFIISGWYRDKWETRPIDKPADPNIRNPRALEEIKYFSTTGLSKSAETVAQKLREKLHEVTYGITGSKLQKLPNGEEYITPLFGIYWNRRQEFGAQDTIEEWVDAIQVSVIRDEVEIIGIKVENTDEELYYPKQSDIELELRKAIDLPQSILVGLYG